MVKGGMDTNVTYSMVIGGFAGVAAGAAGAMKAMGYDKTLPDGGLVAGGAIMIGVGAGTSMSLLCRYFVEKIK